MRRTAGRFQEERLGTENPGLNAGACGFSDWADNRLAGAKAWVTFSFKRRLNMSDRLQVRLGST